MRARSADVKDISNRVVRVLAGCSDVDMADMENMEDTEVIVSMEITNRITNQNNEPYRTNLSCNSGG